MNIGNLVFINGQVTHIGWSWIPEFLMNLYLRLIKNMPQLRNLTLTQLIRREVQVFLIVGTATVLIDLAAYKSLLFYFDFTVNLAKGCGFLSGTLFSYVANRIWTFQNKVFVPGSLYRFLPLYCSTLGINISVNFLILMAFSDIFLIDYIAFIAATGCSTVLNFLGMKFFVFRIANTQRY